MATNRDMPGPDERERERLKREAERLKQQMLDMLKRVPPKYPEWDYCKTHDFKKMAVACQKIAANPKATYQQVLSAFNQLSALYQ